MSNILIYDVAAESGGALSVLNDYYQKALLDVDNFYFFVVSVANIENAGNVRILKYPWIKRSWFHRLYMDNCIVKDIVKKYKIDEVLSLQNHAINGINIRQSVYVHNAIPFCEHKFRLFRDPFLFFYQNIIGFLTKKSLKKASSIIVQTEWMKKAIVNNLRINPNIIKIAPVNSMFDYEPERIKTDRVRFFYPATPFSFKNHKVILDACSLLNSEGRSNIEIIFTISGNENKLSNRIRDFVNIKKLPVNLVGPLNSKKMKEFYKSSCLLFPSYVETVGLPLKEAQCFDAPIIVANLEYAKCSIGSYKNVEYFDYDNPNQLCQMIQRQISNRNHKQ